MKKALLSTVGMIIFSISLLMANPIDDEILAKPESIEKTKWTLGFDMNYGEMMSKPNVNLGLSGSYIINDYFAIGLKGTAVWFDHRLDELDKQKTYHVESGYAGIVIEPRLPISDRFTVSMPVYMGSGMIQYKYDSKYKGEMTWTEEIIDRETFGFFEPGLNLSYILNNNIELSAAVNYRSTSPVKLIETDDQLMNQVNYGIGFKYCFK